jgi:hypothetical protein
VSGFGSVWSQGFFQTTISNQVSVCSSVISSVGWDRAIVRNDLKLVPEHMEEDENTPKALPDWVELEYKVCDAYSNGKNDPNQFPYSI